MKFWNWVFRTEATAMTGTSPFPIRISSAYVVKKSSTRNWPVSATLTRTWAGKHFQFLHHRLDFFGLCRNARRKIVALFNRSPNERRKHYE